MAGFHITPTENSFFDLFADSAKNLVSGADLLGQMVNADADSRIDLAAQVSELEHQGDEATHAIVKKVNSSFITPFDRDDIYDLASALDDCMDFMDEASDLIVLYKVDHLPKKVTKQISILQNMAKLTAQAMPGLKSMNHLSDFWVEINRLENQADRAHRALLADLFDSRTDPIYIMKVKEIIEALEAGADSFEHVAHIVETIAAKES